MIVFAHGLEGTPHGTKIRALREAGFEVVAPDFQGMLLAERVSLLEATTRSLAHRRPLLAGSSYGGLTAAIVAAENPTRFRGLLLCAPAFSRIEAPHYSSDQLRAPLGLPTLVIHGRGDEVVPFSVSEDYVRRSGMDAELIPTADGHRLAQSLAPLVAAAGRLL